MQTGNRFVVTNHYDVRQFYFGKFKDLDPNEAYEDDLNVTNELWEVPGWQKDRKFTIEDGLRAVDITQNDTVRTLKHQGPPADGGPYGENLLEENDLKQYYVTHGDDWTDYATGADSLTYDLGDGRGKITSDIDSVFSWEVEVTAAGGAVYTTLMSFIQLENGDIFSNNNWDSWAENVDDSTRIKSIKLVKGVSNTGFGTLHNQSLPAGVDVVICFEENAAILTPDGPVAAGKLKVGDAVITKDNGIRCIRWINRRYLGAKELQGNPKLLPIRISAGAVDKNCPQRDLLVSPQHRILVESRISARMFDEGVLVAAKHLLDLPGFAVEETDQVTYVHFAFDQHEIVFAEGAPTESFYPGRMALSGMSPEARAELLTLFPELEEGVDEVPGARRFLSGREGRNLAKRHQKNNVALLSSR